MRPTPAPSVSHSPASTTVSMSSLCLASIPSTPGSQHNGGCTPRGRVLKDGWMEKRGARVKKWRRRYFLLFSDPRELRYFDGDKLKGTINMDQVKAVSKTKQPWSKSLDHCYSFELHTAKRVYYISCDSEEELLSWLNEIRTLLTSRSGNGPSSTTISSTTSSSSPSPCNHANIDVRTARAGSVSGAESGGEEDENSNISSSNSGKSGCGAGSSSSLIYLARDDNDEDTSESECMDESEILSESDEHPTQRRGLRKKEGASPTAMATGNKPTGADERLPMTKAIIMDALIACQTQLTEDRARFHENADKMSRDEMVALVKRLRLLNAELQPPSTPRSRPF